MASLTPETHRSSGALIAPPSPRADREIEAAIASIERSIERGGGSVEPGTRAVVREFAEQVLAQYRGPEFERVLSAALLAGELHAPQGMRLDGAPYVRHSFDVAITLKEVLRVGDPDLLCAALLHDTVEDQPSRLAARSNGLMRSWPGREGVKAEALNVIRDTYGERVARLVDHLTNGDFASMAKGSPEAQKDRFPEHRFYRAHVLELFHGESPLERDAFAVKAADFLQNLWGIDRLRELGIHRMVERHEDKRRELTREIASGIEGIEPVHPLYPVRHRVAELMKDVLSRMAPISA